jgi:hypothetical protein
MTNREVRPRKLRLAQGAMWAPAGCRSSRTCSLRQRPRQSRNGSGSTSLWRCRTSTVRWRVSPPTAPNSLQTARTGEVGDRPKMLVAGAEQGSAATRERCRFTPQSRRRRGSSRSRAVAPSRSAQVGHSPSEAGARGGREHALPTRPEHEYAGSLLPCLQPLAIHESGTAAC